MKLKSKILYIALILAVLSNAFVHVNEIKETRLNTAQTLANSAAIDFSNKFVLDILGNHLTMITNLYNRVVKLEERKPTIINVEKYVPDFEKLMNGTVTIYNSGYVVAGVCIAEDETYYYILTVEHLLSDREYSTRRPDNAVPESNMGLATSLGAIALFMTNDEIKELVPKREIINTTVRNRDYMSVAGEFMYVSPMLDLGLLRVYKESGIKLEVIKITDTPPELGDEVYVLGHPLGRYYNLSRGIVSNLDRPFLMSVDALMTFGNSGGGVFNTRGELIGICSRVPVYYIQPEDKEVKERIIDAI